MNYNLLKEVLELLEQFELQADENPSVDDFKSWIALNHRTAQSEPNWVGKERGRSAESVITTLILHMNRYGKTYSKSAIYGSDFSTQEDFIYLINLKAFGALSKMELIKINLHEKPTGMQIINRLIMQGWVTQENSLTDKRSKMLKISDRGLAVLDRQMGDIRKATAIVSGDLSYSEKMELIRLLTKLDNFHQPIYARNIAARDLLDEAFKLQG